MNSLKKQQPVWLRRINVPLNVIRCLLLSAILMTAACMPVQDEHVNVELFKNKEDLRRKAQALNFGMQKESVFLFLDIPRERFETMSTEQVQAAIYGNSQVQGTPEQLEKFKKRMMSYEGYALPYRSIENKGSLGLAKMKYKKTGHDLRLILVFEKDKLIKANVVGTSDINQTQDKYMWNSLLKSGVGAAF